MDEEPEVGDCGRSDAAGDSSAGADAGRAPARAGGGEHLPRPFVGVIDMQVQEIAGRIGDLTKDEYANLYGSLYSLDAIGGLESDPRAQTDELAAIVESFRENLCPWCERGLSEHTLEPDPLGLQIRCDLSGEIRSVAEWVEGPVRFSWRRWLLAGIAWIGIPLVSVGLASWFMPTVAAMLIHRPRWVIPALMWVVLVVLAIVTSDQAGWFSDLMIFTAWLGGAFYGALQVKPWLTELDRRSQRRPGRG